MSNFAQFSGFSGGGAKSSKVQVFVASGTWTCPAANTWVSVVAIGGGGGGLGSNGGASSFGSLAVAAGGSGSLPSSGTGGAGGPGYNRGGRGNYVLANASPVAGAAGIGFLGIGSGGGGTSSGSESSGGGGSGYVATYAGVVSANQTVTVGAAGDTTSSTGAVIVYWLE